MLNPASRASLPERLRGELQTFFPGYFALVMATGIVSLAAHFVLNDRISIALFVLNIVFYVLLWIISLIRLVLYPRQLLDDLTHHARSVTFLTVVAGTMVLGTQFILLSPWPAIAQGLWMLGVVLWLVLIYTFFGTITLRNAKPPLEVGINGSWLLLTVSTESIAILGILIAPEMPAPELVIFLSLCAYLLGAFFYGVVITLMVYRWSFFSFRPDTLTPPYWINMGALAITTLAGSRLLLSTIKIPILTELRPFLVGTTLFFWAASAWWIPLLLIVGIWRHGTMRVPLTYDPQYWALVFPVGMFTVATFMLSKAMVLPFLHIVPEVFVYLSLFVWMLSFAGLLRTIRCLLVGTAGNG